MRKHKPIMVALLFLPVIIACEVWKINPWPITTIGIMVILFKVE
jgi:hypothetical protein